MHFKQFQHQAFIYRCLPYSQFNVTLYYHVSDGVPEWPLSPVEIFVADLRKIVVIVPLMAAYKWAKAFSCWGFVLPQVCQQRRGVSALGLEHVSTRDLGKGGGQEEAACWVLWVTAQDDMSNKQSLHSRQGVCPRGTLDEAQSTLRTWLTHALLPAPYTPSIPISSPQCPITAHSH